MAPEYADFIKIVHLWTVMAFRWTCLPNLTAAFAQLSPNQSRVIQTNSGAIKKPALTYWRSGFAEGQNDSSA